MYDGGKILTGLILGVVLLTFPFWYNLGRAAKMPEPELTAKAKQAKYCVEPKSYMKAYHMDLLNKWRDEVVRGGSRIYVGFKAKEYDMSLQNTCLKCHENKKKFCDECHNFADVKPYCWECHLEPKEAKGEK
ncbi:MAG: sulfate reduction electron transfer complex DsrMKJOP subunit DsrJ [Candidatus Desulfofervidaceae bacterium]|nr:sulfate reduction electron transfer complex DsrMKJOP subunit DsrJ [Candidatus Desulfofervidaceae bacterium]